MRDQMPIVKSFWMQHQAKEAEDAVVPDSECNEEGGSWGQRTQCFPSQSLPEQYYIIVLRVDNIDE